MKPKVILKNGADHYAAPDERIVLISTKTAGSLISIRESGMSDGVLVIDVYCEDGAGVRVRHGGCPGVPVGESVKRGEEMNRESMAMNARERQALAALVTYCRDDELADYEEQEPEDRPGHVYEHLLTLARYLESTAPRD